MGYCQVIIIITSNVRPSTPTISPNQIRTLSKNANNARNTNKFATILATKNIPPLAPLLIASNIFVSFLQQKQKHNHSIESRPCNKINTNNFTLLPFLDLRFFYISILAFLDRIISTRLTSR